MLASILLFLVTGLALAPQTKPPLSAHAVDALVDRYLAEPDRAKRRDLESQLDEQPPLTDREAKDWRKKLIERMRKGKKPKLDGLNYLYDEKQKLGKYIGDAGKSDVLVICMHGGGAGSGDAESAVGAFSATLSKLGVVALYPEVLEKTEHGWGEEKTVRFVLDLIDAAKRARRIDTNRIYLTGHSMGGYGTWTIGGRLADRFAGLAAFAGAATPYFDKNDPGGHTVIGIEEGILPNLFTVPIFFYQSLDDKNVEPWSNLFAAEELKRLSQAHGGYEFTFEKVDGRGHGFPEKGPLPGVKWALDHVRDPRPKQFQWQPYYGWDRMHDWLWWEQPQPSTITAVKLADKNKVEITTDAKEPKGMAILVDERLFDMQSEIEVRVNGDLRIREKPVMRLSTLLRCAAERNDPEMMFAARIEF